MKAAIIKEKYFYAGEIMHELNQLLYLRKSDLGASIEAIWEGHKYYGFPGYIPFGVDSGGWDYNVSIEPETYGQVWVNKFDSGEENPFEFVCKTLEEFVNNLQADERR